MQHFIHVERAIFYIICVLFVWIKGESPVLKEIKYSFLKGGKMKRFLLCFQSFNHKKNLSWLLSLESHFSVIFRILISLYSSSLFSW